MAFIYVITNDINGKQYVGKTNSTIEKRFAEHISDSKKKRYEKRPLYSAMRKYGIEHFYIEALEECSSEESTKKECYQINKLETYGHNGYNATKGGDGKKYYDYKIIAQKYLELRNQKATACFFHCDVDTVNKACREYNITIDDFREVNKRQYGKKVNMVNEDTGDIIKTFNSLSEAARYLRDSNLSHESSKKLQGTCQKINMSAKGQLKHAYGYKWSFV